MSSDILFLMIFLIHYNSFLSAVYEVPLDRKITCTMVGSSHFSFDYEFCCQNVSGFYTEPNDLKMDNENQESILSEII